MQFYIRLFDISVTHFDIYVILNAVLHISLLIAYFNPTIFQVYNKDYWKKVYLFLSTILHCFFFYIMLALHI